MKRKRVVVTGVSAVTPIGNDAETSWNNLVAGKSGVAPITAFDVEPHKTKIAGEVKDFNPELYMGPKEARRFERFTQFSVAAGIMLLKDAGYEITDENAERVGCILGCGLGGMRILEEAQSKNMEGGPRKISPFFIPLLIANMAAGQTSIFTKAKGPNYVTTSACASGLHGVGCAFSEILLGRADAMITGGVESTITSLSFAGFNALKALSTRNETPETASRPFDAERDGFVMGEGCGMLLIEDLELAKARGAKIYAEIVGYGASGDAFHMTAPPDDGAGMAQAMRAAVREAGITPADVDCINAHATSTPLNDVTETRAIKSVFGDHAKNIAVTANKSMIGHCLGGAGGVESVFSVLSLNRGVIPGTINLSKPDPECDLDYVIDGTRNKQVNYVLKNNFGFGGTNACILFKRYEA